MSAEPIPPDLSRLHELGLIRDIDYYLCAALQRTHEIEAPAVLLGAALASRITADGHVCLPLCEWAGKVLPEQREGELAVPDVQPIVLPSMPDWVAALEQCPACAVREPAAGSGGDIVEPLVLVPHPEPRLFLTRYYHYEQQLVTRLAQRAEEIPPALDPGKQDELMDVLFPADDKGGHVKPREAAAAALTKRLLIISGGPGTGKTYTVARLLALLAADSKAAGHDFVVRMAAPTGKAAMRMVESIRKAKEEGLAGLDPELRAGIPEEAQTLHRLLGTRTRSPHFRHNADNPLDANVVIVDEASMVDLPLMAKLLDALPEQARLILLGDMHQLSSVEPGFVLGDICAAARKDSHTALDGCLVELTHSWRFDAGGAIGRLSGALHSAGEESDPEGEQAWQKLQFLASPQGEDREDGTRIRWREAPPSLRDGNKLPIRDFRTLVLNAYRPFLAAETPADAFKALETFRILSPRRSGRYGVSTLNALVEEVLSLKNMKLRPDENPPKRLLNPSKKFYDHRVIMINRNDYGLRLFNGDIGIVLPETADGGEMEAGTKARLVAWFEGSDRKTGEKKARSVPCSMLPDHETAFAMTVHKSQGSQFADLLVVVPPEESPLLTKELLYTAVTRAVKGIDLWCNREQFVAAAINPVKRSGGLRDALEAME